MKKLFAIVMTLVLLLTVGTVFTSAANRGTTPGAYVIGQKKDFRPVGDINIQWVPDAAKRISCDGDMSEWADFEPHRIGPENMISWVGYNDDKSANGEGAAVDKNMPKNWSVSDYYLADADYLYIGLYIVDDDVVAVDPQATGNYASGDSFQINLDLGTRLSDIVEMDPDMVSIMNRPQNPFYSFGYAGDHRETTIVRQCTNSRDGYLTRKEHDVLAYTGKTDDGWCAELRLPWEELCLDYLDQTWYLEEGLEDPTIYMGGEDNIPLRIGLSVYYLNHSTGENGSSSGINWAAGTTNGTPNPEEVPSGAPVLGWDAYDLGITLNLAAGENVKLNTEYIQNPLPEEPTAPPASATIRVISAQTATVNGVSYVYLTAEDGTVYRGAMSADESLILIKAGDILTLTYTESEIKDIYAIVSWKKAGSESVATETTAPATGGANETLPADEAEPPVEWNTPILPNLGLSCVSAFGGMGAPMALLLLGGALVLSRRRHD